jgi:predicted N-acetyltransferase YhbS
LNLFCLFLEQDIFADHSTQVVYTIGMSNLKITTLSEQPDLIDQATGLIETQLGYSFDNSFAVDFYPLFNEKNWENCFVLVDNDKVVAHLGVKFTSIVVQDAHFPLAFLGGICVATEQQGRGHLRVLLNYVIEQFESTVALFCLWSELDQLYQKFDFHEAGNIYQLNGQRNPSELKGLPPSQLTTLQKVQMKHLRSLLQERIHLLHRTDQDWEDIFKVESSRFVIADDFYLVYNKGQDLDGIIHEFAHSNPEEFSKAFSGFQLWTPCPHDLSAVGHSLYLGHFRIGAHSHFSPLIAQLTNKKIEILASNHKEVEFALAEKEIRTKISSRDFLQGCLGPHYIRELNLLQKPIFISGLESV